MIGHFPQTYSGWQTWRWVVAILSWFGFFVNQPMLAQSTPNISTYDLNNIIYLDGFVYPCSDVGLNSAISALGSSSGTINAQGCASITFSSVTVDVGPYVKILFNPHGTESQTWTGPALRCSDVPTTYGGDGGFFDLNLSSATNSATAIDVRECTFFQIWNDKISMTGTGAVGILFETQQKWTEQTDLNNVNIFAPVAIDLQDNCTGHSGCPSFAYGTWRHVFLEPASSGIGVKWENDTVPNHSDLDITCIPAQGAICYDVVGVAQQGAFRLYLRGELAGGATSATGISIASGSAFIPIALKEEWNSGITDSISGTIDQYVMNLPGYGFWQAFSQGPAFSANGNSFSDTIDVSHITTYRTLTAPDGSGTLPLSFNVTLGSTSPGCATGAGVGDTCTTSNLSLPFTQPDTSYRIACTGKAPTGVPTIVNVTNSSTTQFTITIAALTAAASSFASADCVVGH